MKEFRANLFSIDKEVRRVSKSMNTVRADKEDEVHENLNPLVHGRFSRPIVHGGGGIVRPLHNPYWKWYQTIPRFTHSLPLIFVEQIFSFEGARPEKGLKIWPF